jgi:type VI secretion system protein ImpJ
MARLMPEIHWEDGGLLRPQHLQAFQQHCQGLVSQLALARSFGYGIRRLKLRAESVGNWIVELEHCDAVLPDGTVLVVGETATVPPCEFGHLNLDDTLVEVWLGVPLVNPGAPNVASGGDAGGRRYVIEPIEMADENTGKNPQEIGVKRLNGRLFVGQRPPDDHTAFKIAELKKVITEGEEGRRYELSTAFVPACLSLDASTQLHTIVKDVLDSVEEKNSELLGHLRGQRDLLTGESMERPETLIKLQATNSVLPVLRQLNGQPEMHPFDVYLQLCRLVGDLAIFGDNWEPPRLVLYDHADPLKAYNDFKSAVLMLLSRAVDTAIERTPFATGASPGTWQVEVPERYLTEGAQLFLGIETGRGYDEVAPLFLEGRTVLAAPEELPLVRRARIEGVPCRAEANLHPSLKDREGLVFLSIHQSGDFWPAVAEKRILCLAGEAAGEDDMKYFLYAAGLKGRDA